jgi:hypothetical protein
VRLVGLVVMLTGCATGGRPSELDPEILEVQAVVLEHVLEETKPYLEEVDIDEVCIVAAVHSRVRGVERWAGNRGREGEWAAEILTDRLAAEGWRVLPAQACDLDDDRWFSLESGAEAVVASAATMLWEDDDLVFVDAGLARSLEEQFRYECTVVRAEAGWVVDECTRPSDEGRATPQRTGRD